MRFPEPLARVARGVSPVLLAQSVALAVVTSWPSLPRLTEGLAGSLSGDTSAAAWSVWWMRHELYTGPVGFHTRLVNFPDGAHIYPISPIDGLIASLLPFSADVVTNLLALLHLVLLGLCGAWLGAEVTRSRVGAHVAGALAQASAFAGFTVAAGLVELRPVWILPLGLAVAARAERSGRRAWFVALGAVIGAAVAASAFLGTALAVAVGAYALAAIVRRPGRIGRYVTVALIAAAIGVPSVRVLADTRADPLDGVVVERSGEGAAPYGADPRRGAALTPPPPLSPGASASVDELLSTSLPARPPGVAAGAPVLQGGRYLGVIAVLLAGVGVARGGRRARPWALVALACVLLALGPVLQWRALPVVAWGSEIPLPFRALDALFVALAEPMRFPVRFLAPAGVALAVLGAVAVVRVRPLALLVPLAFADGLREGTVRWPREILPADDLATLQEIPGHGAVADLGAILRSDDAERRRLSMSAQRLLGRPFSSVPIQPFGQQADSAERWLRALPLVRAATSGGGPPADWSGDVFLLRDRGYDAVLVAHGGRALDARVDALLTRALGPAARAQSASLWPIPAGSMDPGRASALRAAQAERVRALAVAPQAGGQGRRR